MCGILGSLKRDNNCSSIEEIKNAIHSLVHRGPDDNGCESFKAKNSEIILAQTRLSIVDLTDSGHQPMCSKDGQYALVFNGEIYNYNELRDRLISLGHYFNTKTDSEVLLKSWMQWGADCLNSLDGMFAFAILDSVTGILHLIRDPFGIKPLYYYQSKNSFVFASEIVAIQKLIGVNPKLHREQALRYLIDGEYDVDSETFVKDVFHILPGYHMQISCYSLKNISYSKWYRPSINERLDISFESAADELRHLFLESVKQQMRSDVPIGAALSGGLDSSSIVCAMRYLEPDMNLETFSYIADNPEVSEEHWIDFVNAYTKSIPHKVYASEENLASDIDALIYTQGEPFAGVSYYAEFCLYREAKKCGIKVLLDGHGADELLCGYDGYPAYRIRSLIESNTPLGAFLFAKRWSQWPGRGNLKALKAITHGFISAAGVSSVSVNLLRRFARKFSGSTKLLATGVTNCDVTIIEDENFSGRGLVHQLKNQLTLRGCPPQLRSADRSAMKSSIENRVPFLTPKIANFLLQVPEKYLISDHGETKHLFRHAMRGIVPDEILSRKDKIGYAMPAGMILPATTKLMSEIESTMLAMNFLDSNTVKKLLFDKDRKLIRLDGKAWRLFNLLRWVYTFKVEI